MSDLAKRLRFIPTDLRVVVPVHFPAMFTQHERMPTLNTLDAGIVAHESADRIDALEECLRELAAMTAAQAEDEGLWFNAMHASEGYLQQELRKLHAAIENKARALLEE